MFNIKDSKLYTQIMEGIRDFFGLPADANESDVHNALDGQKSLQEQLEAAAKTDERLNEITDRLNTMEAEMKTMREESEAKDQRVAELQVQIAELETLTGEKETAIEALKTAHAKETKTLAGEISKLKAGKVLEQDEGGDQHEAGKNKEGEKVFTMTDDSLKRLVQANRN
jgi:predicted nuclease with TOPRIM domain